MNRKKGFFLLLVGTLFCCSIYAAQNAFSLQFGPTWPRDLLDSGKPTVGDVSVGYGISVDQVVGFGVAADFLWNRNEKTDRIGAIEVPYENIGTYMFPVSGFIFIDPLPSLVVHPVLRFTVGYNSLIYQYDIDTTLSNQESERVDPDGYYYGLYLRPSLEAMYNFSESTGVYAGLSYRWAKTKSAKEYSIENSQQPGTYLTGKRIYDMSGLGIHLGLQIYL